MPLQYKTLLLEIRNSNRRLSGFKKLFSRRRRRLLSSSWSCKIQSRDAKLAPSATIAGCVCEDKRNAKKTPLVCILWHKAGFPLLYSHEFFFDVRTLVPWMRIISLGRKIHAVVEREKFPRLWRKNFPKLQSGYWKSRHGNPCNLDISSVHFA